MDNVISFQDFATPTGFLSDNPCWLCQKPTSSRALFCHHCGTIQPVRDIDHFTRLGMEHRVDINPEVLEKQYLGFRKTLDPARFSLRGVGERTHAARQLEALNAAYETLRDPLKRGRYWMALHKKDFTEPEAMNPTLAEMWRTLNDASEASTCDRVASNAGHLLEQGVMHMIQALRAEDWQKANDILVELDGLEAVLKTVRARRKELAGPSDSSGPRNSIV